MNNVLKSPEIIAKFLKINKVDTVFGLCGGHIMPSGWNLIKLVLELLTQEMKEQQYLWHILTLNFQVNWIALVTAGPGLTNALTGIANAHISRSHY